MAYCSLEDAFASINPSKQEQPLDTSSQIDVHSNLVDAELPSEKVSCTNALKHIETCSRCKKKLMKRYRKLKTELVEDFANHSKSITITKNNQSDVVIMVALGVFIIFVLDIFVRLGKYLSFYPRDL